MNKAKIYISVPAYQKMRLWVEMARGEISWLGTVSEIKNTHGVLDAFLIEDIHLLKQACTGANTTLDDLSVGQFLGELAAKKHDISKVKAWIHSHGELKCFWSGTDEECISNLANSSYLISIVTNKEGNILARVDIFRPFQVTVNDVKVDIFYPDDDQLVEFCRREFKEKVTETAIYFGGPIHQPFPGTSDIDRKIDELEERVSTGKISLAEYQHEISKLEADHEPFWD